MPVWLTRMAMITPTRQIGIMASRVQRSKGSGPSVTTIRRTPNRLRTAIAEVARIAPDAVEKDAATIPDRTRIASSGGA